MTKNKPEYVSAAWIATQLGIHPTAVEKAWRCGDLAVAVYILGGNEKYRPAFERAVAESWYRSKTKVAR